MRSRRFGLKARGSQDALMCEEAEESGPFSYVLGDLGKSVQYSEFNGTGGRRKPGSLL